MSVSGGGETGEESHMRRALMLVAVLLAIAAPLRADEAQDRQAALDKILAKADRFWKSLDDPAPGLSSRGLMEHALALCEAKQHPERLEKLFALTRRMVDDDP